MVTRAVLLGLALLAGCSLSIPTPCTGGICSSGAYCWSDGFCHATPQASGTTAAASTTAAATSSSGTSSGASTTASTTAGATSSSTTTSGSTTTGGSTGCSPGLSLPRQLLMAATEPTQQIVFVAGGLTANDTPTSSIELFTDAGHAAFDGGLPVPLFGATAVGTQVSDGGEILVFGGCDGSAAVNTVTRFAAGDLIAALDSGVPPVTSALSPMPLAVSGAVATLSTDGLWVFVTGGTTTCPALLAPSTLTNALQIYDVANDRWLIGPPMTRGRGLHGATTVLSSGVIYAAGGVIFSPLHTTFGPSSSVETLQLDAGVLEGADAGAWELDGGWVVGLADAGPNWISQLDASLSTQRVALTLTVDQAGTLLAIGGATDYSTKNPIDSMDVFLSPAWTATGIPGPRAAAVATAGTNGNIWLIGGFTMDGGVGLTSEIDTFPNLGQVWACY